ncbi:tripartite ATP-independent transporter DctM subunit [Halomonas fontilapidosi]|uniref:TRAP transporter large permease protein n=1 Tax=Halomonas fontilapidosi TaxID=616675 RepID=A0A7W5DMS7_9GAMM|nr:TRAP transporter large permease [Halomonas fontilapidosi]MBB3185364.1 tripartite ATP-independent transporter DctM subunit [Halomonas fontilapidosi]
MEGLFAILLLLLLMGLGVPVAWSFAGVLAYLAVAYDANLDTLMMQGFRSVDSVILIALPLFVLTGYLMQSGGIASRLVTFIETLVGKRRGGMGASMVLASGVFGAIAGTATAAVASIGTIMIVPLEQRGYPRGYASALLGISSLLGILIPPSITMILFAVVTRQSVAALFAATVGPALLLIVGLILANRLACGRLFQEVAGETQGSAKPLSKGRATWRALPALSLPFIILGGIYGGVFTPTEAAAVAAFAAMAIGFLVYRDQSLTHFSRSVVAAAETTGSIILILLFSFMIGRILAFERVPQDLTELITTLIQNPLLILIAVNVFLILAGAILDDVSVTVVVAPLFLPLMVDTGIHPVHFGAIVACSVVIGANSPPVAPILYMACRIGRVSIHKTFAPALQLIAFVGIPVMLVTTFVPELSLFLPRLLGFI